VARLLFITAPFYLGAFVVFLLGLKGKRKEYLIWAERALYSGFFLQVFVFFLLLFGGKILILFDPKKTSWNLSLILVGLYLFLKGKLKLKGFGGIIGLFAFILTVLASFPGSLDIKQLALHPVWSFVHVLLCFIGIGGFSLAFSAGLIYLLEEGKIKNKKLGSSKLLPSLDALDRLNQYGLFIGFFSFTPGIILGGLWALLVLKALPLEEPKVLFSVLSWFYYGLLMWGRLSGWRGKRVARLSVIGFAILMVSYFGVNFLVGGHPSHLIQTRLR
jgi:ABC-type uncharacterized transport system permease subunit